MAEADAIPRARLHRATFTLAGIYNLVWGVWTALDPQALFRFAGMEPLNYPEIFQCLAMVIGLYGLAYLEVARRPSRGWLFAAVGFTGKILGPIGLVVSVAQGRWPIRAGVMCLTNDLIWWVPFGIYLVDAWPSYRRDWSRPQ